MTHNKTLCRAVPHLQECLLIKRSETGDCVVFTGDAAQSYALKYFEKQNSKSLLARIFSLANLNFSDRSKEKNCRKSVIARLVDELS